MSRIVVHTHLAAAAKLTFELEASKVVMKPIGGADGVPPGMTLSEGEQVVLWVGAQDFGVAVVDDGRLISTEPAVP